MPLSSSPPLADAAGALADLDRLWNYEKPEETAAKVRERLAEAEAAGDHAAAGELLTQLARTEGLRHDFAAAHATLDRVEALLQEHPDLRRVRIRYLLERGRAHNTSGHPDRAVPLFDKAFELAGPAREDYLAVDAAHMLGIAAPRERRLEWSQRALELAERSADPRARTWLGPLLNNLGWTYHERGEWEESLDAFRRGLAWRLEEGQDREARVAEWCVGRALRAMGRYDEALALQTHLRDRCEAAGERPGYVHEEMGECLLALQMPQAAAPHFAEAYEVLAKDPALVRDEPARLQRLRQLGESVLGVSPPAVLAEPS